MSDVISSTDQLPVLRLATDKGALYQGDSLQLLRQIKADSIDCIFADPPFNLGKNYAPGVKDLLPEDQYLEWTHRWLTECVRVLKPGGSLFVYHIPKWLFVIGGFLNALDSVQFRHWIAIKMKNGFPIRGRLHPAHYGLLYYTKLGKKHKFHVVRSASPTCRHCKQLVRDYGGYLKKYPKNKGKVPLIRLADFWDDISPKIYRKNRPNAVNELPSIIPERAITISTNKGDIILDPFAGGGITLSTAQLRGRYWIGCELGPTEYACERILTEAGTLSNAELPKKLRRIFP
jgi:site-specific DNA-methyltransferase (adenine-specific)